MLASWDSAPGSLIKAGHAHCRLCMSSPMSCHLPGRSTVPLDAIHTFTRCTGHRAGLYGLTWPLLLGRDKVTFAAGHSEDEDHLQLSTLPREGL